MGQNLPDIIRFPCGEDVDFRTPSGRQVWENIRDPDAMRCLHNVHSYAALKGWRRERVKRELAAFLYAAAFRHELDTLPAMDFFLKTVATHSEIDPDVFRVHTVDRSRRLVFDDGEVPVGGLNGYTNVVPLTQDAFAAFAETDMAPEDLDESHSLVAGAAPKPHTHLYVASIVHLPSLGGESNATRYEAGRLVLQLIDHVASWITPFRLHRGRFKPLTEGSPLPKLVCLRDHRGMAGKLISRLGFRHQKKSKDRLGGMSKYILDFSWFNDGRRLNRARRQTLRRVHGLLSENAGWREMLS